ncbi:hypothetical protein, partial [Staphylococcus xylosus]|nr:hypothetical protein [Staphylococcus xylosus]
MIDTFLRNKRVAIILVIIIAFLVFIDYKTPFFDVLMSNKKYDEILTFTETIIAFSSITTAFLFFGVSFIPMISD